MKTSESNDRASTLTYNVLLIAACSALMVMPFISTLNEIMATSDFQHVDALLASVAAGLHLTPLMNDWVIPVTLRMVAMLVRPFGIEAVMSQSSLYLSGWGRFALVQISWNCIGWQGFILFLVTLVTGLQGSYTWPSKLQCLLLGAVGTFTMNLVRIVLVAVVAFFLGRTPAIFFHDYASTLLTIGWLVTFWFCAFTLILEEKQHPRGNSETVQNDARRMHTSRERQTGPLYPAS